MDKPSKELKTWQALTDDYNKFKVNCKKEGINVGDKINQMIAKDNLDHGDGNPAYKIDQWFGKNEMLAIPAVKRSAEDWWEWFVSCKDPKMIQDIIWQAQMIGARAQKRLQQF
jgi:hypothetical protein